MGTDTRFAITMGVTLLIWSPAAIGLFRGNIDFTWAAIRFALALALVSIAVSLINKLVVKYGTENAVREIHEAEARHVNAEINIDLDR